LRFGSFVKESDESLSLLGIEPGFSSMAYNFSFMIF
jgi:hypothetical protein